MGLVGEICVVVRAIVVVKCSTLVVAIAVEFSAFISGNSMITLLLLLLLFSFLLFLLLHANYEFHNYFKL